MQAENDGQTVRLEAGLARVLVAFGLGPVLAVQTMGGTAASKWSIQTAAGRFVARIRPEEFAAEPMWQFDHHILRRLVAAGLPVPEPVEARTGQTVVELDGQVYEVLRWIEAEPFSGDDPQALVNLGRFLATFHAALARDLLPGKQGCLREDHPQLMRGYLESLFASQPRAGQLQTLQRIAAELERIQHELDDALYDALPEAVIHGDVHPGNFRFRESRVAAVYDFDYLSRQARVRDLCDAMMFFGSSRTTALNPDDIRSLTQPFVPEAARCRLLVAGYQSISPLETEEWQAMPLLIRSRWLQIRLRGARKVPPAEKLDFVVNGMDEVLDWLDLRGNEWSRQLRQESSEEVAL